MTMQRDPSSKTKVNKKGKPASRAKKSKEIVDDDDDE